MTTTCSRCHEAQPDGTKFCMSCGARFAYDLRSTPAPAPAPDAAFAPTVATEAPTKPGIPEGAAVRASRPAVPSRGEPPAAAPPPRDSAVDHKSVVVATVLGKLVGLDARSGEVVWEHGIEPGTPQLVIADGLVLAAVGQSLYCCDYRTGRPMWRAALSVHAQRITMVLEGERIFAFGAGAVDAFDRAGRRLWTRTIAEGALASGAIGLPGNVSQADRD